MTKDNLIDVGIGIIIGLVALSFGVGIIKLMEIQQNNIEKSAKLYEDCIIEQYGGHTVLELYYKTGEYPECK